jgi:DNA-binding NtrC family response regulator
VKVLLTLQDVEPAVRINALLEREGVQTALVSPLDDIHAALAREHPDIIVFTGELTDPLTVSIVKAELWNGTAVVGLSDNVDSGHLDRMRAVGYVEVYPKPVNVDEVVGGLHRILDRRRLQQLTGLIGESDAMREIMVQVELIAPVSSTVLIEGESGTGKELVARAIRMLSNRRNKPFIAVNVGALPESLLESELFGHEKGAFTGAAERRLGRFELADTGTLFLDEIGEIPSSTQVKLLRVLEEREFVRVGGALPIRIDVRVVAATNQPLRELVEEGEFRADLFYRLNVLRMYLPPLRERPEDVPLLVRRFIQDYSKEHDRPFHGISADAMQMLVEYAWPGNVRELRNLVESMVVLSPGHEIQPVDLPRQIRDGGTARLLPVHTGPIVRGQEAASGRELEFIVRSLLELKLQVEELRRRVNDDRPARGGWIADVQSAGLAGGGGRHAGVLPPASGGHAASAPPASAIEPPGQPAPPNTVTIAAGATMAAIERQAIEMALKENRGNRRRAAEMLGIGERTLYRKIREYRLPEQSYSDGHATATDDYSA